MVLEQQTNAFAAPEIQTHQLAVSPVNAHFGVFLLHLELFQQLTLLRLLKFDIKHQFGPYHLQQSLPNFAALQPLVVSEPHLLQLDKIGRFAGLQQIAHLFLSLWRQLQGPNKLSNRHTNILHLCRNGHYLDVDGGVDVQDAGLVAHIADVCDEVHGAGGFVEPLAGEGGQAALELLLLPFIGHFDLVELVGAMQHGDVDKTLVEGELLSVPSKHAKQYQTQVSYCAGIMKTNSRFLPRLNLCYLQKKAYEQHRNKISRIKSSLADNRLQKCTSRHFTGPDRVPATAFLEESTTNFGGSPFKRKYMREAAHENFRLFAAIRKCKSTIKPDQLKKHSLRSEEDKQRIMKFKTDPASERRVLKCELSLQKLTSRQRSGMEMAVSRLFVTTPSNAGQKQLKQIEVGLKQQARRNRVLFRQSPKQRQVQFKRSLERNLQKVRQHIETQQTRLISKQKLEGYREKTTPSEGKMHISQIHRWKTRALKTQMESYQ